MPHLPISEGAQWVFQRRRGIQAIIHGSRENQSPIVRANIEKWDGYQKRDLPDSQIRIAKKSSK